MTTVIDLIKHRQDKEEEKASAKFQPLDPYNVGNDWMVLDVQTQLHHLKTVNYHQCISGATAYDLNAGQLLTIASLLFDGIIPRFGLQHLSVLINTETDEVSIDFTHSDFGGIDNVLDNDSEVAKEAVEASRMYTVGISTSDYILVDNIPKTKMSHFPTSSLEFDDVYTAPSVSPTVFAIANKMAKLAFENGGSCKFYESANSLIAVIPCSAKKTFVIALEAKDKLRPKTS